MLQVPVGPPGRGAVPARPEGVFVIVVRLFRLRAGAARLGQRSAVRGEEPGPRTGPTLHDVDFCSPDSQPDRYGASICSFSKVKEG